VELNPDELYPVKLDIIGYGIADDATKGVGIIIGVNLFVFIVII
jgi:hypothetical protein